MSTRTGTCKDCGQRYDDIPDSVTLTEVKCQVCSGTVVIPPLATSTPGPPTDSAPVESASSPAPAAPASASAGDKIPAAPKPASAAGGLSAKPLGQGQKKSNRPAAAAPIDRTVARPQEDVKPLAKKTTGKAPSKPVFAGKATPAKPFRPVKKAVPKKAATSPVKPVSSATPTAASKASAAAKGASPAAQAPSSNQGDAAKKAKAAEIIARAKAKRTQAASPAAKAPQKASGADLIAQLKAKKMPAAAASNANAERSPSKVQSSSHQEPAEARKKNRRSRVEREESSRRAREHANENNGWKVGVLSLVGLGLVAGAWYWMNSANNEDTVLASDPNTEVSADPSAPANSDSIPPAVGAKALEFNAEPAAADSTPDTQKAVEADGSKQSADAEPKTTDSPPPKPAAASAEFIPPAPGEAANTRGISDFFALDLSLIPEIPKWEQLSDEEYATIQEDLALFLDDQGARSNRAGYRLNDYGRGAYAVVVNALMDQDFSTKEGMYVSTTLNDLLYKICNSNKNFGWEDTGAMQEGSEEFLSKALLNKKIAVMWQRYWYLQQFATNDSAWDKMCGLSKKAESEKAPVENSTDDLFDD
jgi:hypothetical protein